MDLFGVGQLHRQGDLRRRRLRGGHRPDLPREPDPQPRPDRGELRPLRPGDATSSCSTTSRPATTPTPAASTAGSAATGSSSPGSAATVPTPDGPRPNPLPLLERWKIFDNLRRSLVPPALVAAAGPGLDGPARLALALDGGRRWRCPALPLLQLRHRHGRSAASASRSLGASCGDRRDSVPADGRPGRCCRSRSWPTRRGWLVDAIVRTLVPAARHAGGTCWSGRPPRRPSAGWAPGLANFVADMWPAPALAAGARRCWSALVRPGGPAGGGAGPGSPGSSRRWSPTGSAGRRRAGRVAADRRRARPSCGGSPARPGTSSRPSSATTTTGSRPTTSRRSPDGRVAHRTSPTNQGLLLLSTLAAHDLGYLGLRHAGRPAGEDVRHASTGWRSTGATSTTGTTRRPCSRCRRPTSRPSTAATCSAAWSTLEAGAAGEGRRRRCSARRSVDGLADTLGLVAEASAAAASTPTLRRALLAASRPATCSAGTTGSGRLDWAAVALIGRVRAAAGAGRARRSGRKPGPAGSLAQVRERRAELAARRPLARAAPRLARSRRRPPAWAGRRPRRRWRTVRAALIGRRSSLAGAGRAGPTAILAELAALEAVGPGRPTALRGDRRRRSASSTAADLLAPAPPAGRAGRGDWPTAMDFRSSTRPTATCSRSAATWRRAGSTAPATTCWPPRRA